MPLQDTCANSALIPGSPHSLGEGLHHLLCFSSAATRGTSGRSTGSCWFTPCFTQVCVCVCVCVVSVCVCVSVYLCLSVYCMCIYVCISRALLLMCRCVYIHVVYMYQVSPQEKKKIRVIHLHILTSNGILHHSSEGIVHSSLTVASFPVSTPSFFSHVVKKSAALQHAKKSWEWRLGTRLA